MNMYTKLRFHLERHMYKKGAHKGEAPAGKRSMSHFRVVKGNDGSMRVRMHGTDIITARDDGSVRIDTGGWWDHNTTRLRLNDAFGFFDGLRVQIYRQSVLSYSQPVLNVDGKRYRYYDGITLGATGELLTPMQPFEMRRIDKTETKDLANDLTESGFKDAYALLYATATPDNLVDNYHLFGVRLPEALTDNDQGHIWQDIIAKFKYEREYWGHRQWQERSNAKACWATIMAECKKNMYVVLASDTYVL